MRAYKAPQAYCTWQTTLKISLFIQNHLISRLSGFALQKYPTRVLENVVELMFSKYFSISTMTLSLFLFSKTHILLQIAKNTQLQ